MTIEDLPYVKTVDGIEYYRFTPRIGKWYYDNYPGYKRHSLSHNIRMLIEYLEGGYEIFYMANSGGGTRIPSCCQRWSKATLLTKGRYCNWTYLGGT